MTGIFIYDAKYKKNGGFLPSEPDSDKDYEIESYADGLVKVRNNFDNSIVEKRISFASDGTILPE